MLVRPGNIFLDRIRKSRYTKGSETINHEPRKEGNYEAENVYNTIFYDRK